MTLSELIKTLDNIELRENGKRDIKSYVLRNNVLDEKDKKVLEKYGEKYLLSFKNEEVNFSEYFLNHNPVVFEIGFGMGDTTLDIATTKPDINFVGLEVYLKGVIKLLSLVGENNLENIKILRFDAKTVLLNMTQDESVDGFHIFFPDPWPKKKHHKRRLLNSEFLSLLAKKLKKGGYIYFVTDWAEYATFVKEETNNVSLLKEISSGYSKIKEWRKETKFEKKGLEKNHSIFELWLEKQ